jgi:hypothetical protein
MTDWVTPNYRKKIAAGEIIMNPMNSRYTTRSCSTLSNYSAATGGAPPPARGSGFWGHYLGVPTDVNHLDITLISESDRESLNKEVTTRCLSRIGRTSVDNWENMAELGKTLEMIRHPINAFWKFDKRFWSGKTLTAFRGVGQTAAQSAANAWLAYRYGIAPVVSSVSGTIEALRKTIRPVRKTTRAAGKLQATSSLVTGWDSSGHHYRYGIQKTDWYEVRAMSLDEATIELYPGLGLSAKSVITLPWELTPWSFVADWFFNVGDYIGGLANAFQPRSLGQCHVMTSVITELRQTTSMWTDPPVTLLSPFSGVAKTDTIAKNRIPFLGGPSIAVKSDFKFDSATRIGDSLALIGQQLLKRFRI